MTTPERLKRRQIREGLVLILLAIFTVVQAVYFNLEDRQQSECVRDNFSEFARVTGFRADIGMQDSELQRRETAVSKKIWLTFAEAAGVIKDDPSKPLPPDEQARLNGELVKNLLEYKETISEIEEEREQLQRERRRNPVPPFPVGECNAQNR